MQKAKVLWCTGVIISSCAKHKAVENESEIKKKDKKFKISTMNIISPPHSSGIAAGV